MNRRAIVLPAVLAAVLVQSSPAHPGLSAAEGSACRPPGGRERIPQGVEVTLRLSERSISTGETLGFKLTVRNRGSRTVRYFSGSPESDYWIKGPDGVVWVWSYGGVFTDELAHGELKPGEVERDRERWHFEDCTGAPAELVAGTYRARAMWTASRNGAVGREGWWSQPVEFEIR